MSWLVLFSRDGLWDENRDAFHAHVQDVVNRLVDAGHYCALVSNRNEKPSWLEEFSYSPNFKFLPVPGRKQKDKVRKLLRSCSVDWSKVLVVSCTDDDFVMSINSRLLFLVGRWSNKIGKRISQYGIKIDSPRCLLGAIELLSSTEPWYYSYQSKAFSIYSMTNAGDHNSISEMKPIVSKLRNHLKCGDNTDKVIFNLLFISSLLKTPPCENIDYWAYYPSSSIKQKQDEIISSYAEIARASLSCKAQHPHPIFVRHKAVQPRHSAGSSDRINPIDQVQSIHIHNHYEGKLKDKTVAVVDDFTTYGTSFGVAEALLKKAGAKNVICFALGKFGNTTHKYEINANRINPFKPIEIECLYSSERITNAHTKHQALNDLVTRIKNLQS